MAPQIKAGDRGCISPCIDRRTSRQRARLRCKPNCALAFRHIKRLDAVGVAGKPELLPQRVPQGKCVHAAQLAQPRLAPLRDGIDQDLGVAVGVKDATQALEFQSQRTIIIDLAIKADHPATRRIRHWLLTADDRCR